MYCFIKRVCWNRTYFSNKQNRTVVLLYVRSNIIERKTSWARDWHTFCHHFVKESEGLLIFSDPFNPVKTGGFWSPYSPSCFKKLNNFKTVQVLTTKHGNFPQICTSTLSQPWQPSLTAMFFKTAILAY